ncbi:MAG: DUF3152 domain-containing protein [Candidatus Saccharimonadales bacterium]
MKLVQLLFKVIKKVIASKPLFITISTLFVAVLGFLYWWNTQSVVADVTYDQCQASYGKVVSSWDGTEDSEGSSENSWNQAGIHYQIRAFNLHAHAPDVKKPLTIQDEPTVIASGGDQACLDDFDETIDLLDDRYRYNGARAKAIRLGVPDVNQNLDSRISAQFIKRPSILSRLNPFSSLDIAGTNLDLATPVYDSYPGEAAAWVNDGGRATIISDSDEKELWCINYGDCGDIAEQLDDGTPKRGAGYQFVLDNCPGEDIVCNQDWYVDFATEDILPTINNSYSFNLRLEATSTYAPYVGAETLMVFAYPKEISIDPEVAASSTELSSGEDMEIDIMLNKSGPKVDNLEIVVDSNNQPLEIADSLILDADQLSTLNSLDRLSISLKGRINSGVLTQRCHDLGIEIIDGGNNLLATDSLEYCIDNPKVIFTYSIDSAGETVAGIDELAILIAQTLSDSRGWSQADVGFRRVGSGGDFTLWLAAPDQMQSFSSACSAEYSCRVGRDVIINDLRWRGGTPAWNEAGGSLRGYRHMVINHEVGHFLGFGHLNCLSTGDLAPVMLQQSIDLGGCEFNPWPRDYEIEMLASWL